MDYMFYRRCLELMDPEDFAVALCSASEDTQLAVVSSLWDDLLESGVIMDMALLFRSNRAECSPSLLRLITERAVKGCMRGPLRSANFDILAVLARLKQFATVLHCLPDTVAKNERILVPLSENDAIPAEYLARLVRDTMPLNVARSIAARPDMPPEVLLAVADRYLQVGKSGGVFDFSVAFSMAGNPAAPPEVLARIATYERTNICISLRQVLARNPNTPAKYLSVYAFDYWGVVRENALQNPSLPLKTIRKVYMLADRDPDRLHILTALAENPSCPDDILMGLILDRDLFVSAVARKVLAQRR